MKSLTTFSVSRGRTVKERTIIGRFAVFNLLVILSITKLDITFSDICNFLVTGIVICKMFFFVKWKTRWFVFYLSCRTITVISKMVLFLWSSQGDYVMNSYINWWKLLIFTWINTSMKDVSTKVNLFALRCSYLERFLKMPGRYRSLLNV